MKIRLPSELEDPIQAAVASGRFASVDDAMAEAARLLVRELSRRPPAPPPAAEDDPPDSFWGLMRDDAELMDEIVADAYRQRQAGQWREFDL